MTEVRPTRLGHGSADFGSRDFDYGVGDDLHNAVERMRTQIATSIRQAAALNRTATPDVRAVYELAARIAETAR